MKCVEKQRAINTVFDVGKWAAFSHSNGRWIVMVVFDDEHEQINHSLKCLPMFGEITAQQLEL